MNLSFKTNHLPPFCKILSHFTKLIHQKHKLSSSEYILKLRWYLLRSFNISMAKNNLFAVLEVFYSLKSSEVSLSVPQAASTAAQLLLCSYAMLAAELGSVK